MEGLPVNPSPDGWRATSLRPFTSDSTGISNHVKAILRNHHADALSLPQKEQERNTACSNLWMPTEHSRVRRGGKGKGNPLQPQNNWYFFFLFCLWFEWVETLKKSCGIEVFSLLFPL